MNEEGLTMPTRQCRLLLRYAVTVGTSIQGSSPACTFASSEEVSGTVPVTATLLSEILKRLPMVFGAKEAKIACVPTKLGDVDHAEGVS